MTAGGPVDLATRLGELTLPTPVLTAAGCGGTGRELAPYCDLAALGAFTTRTITLDPRPGAPRPRLVDTPGGVLHEHGGHNPGLQTFLATELPWLAQHAVRTMVSVAADTLGEYAELARRLGESPGVTGVEVNLGNGLGTEPFQAGKILHVVRREVPQGVAVLAKPAPTGDQAEAARAVLDNGADAVVLGHGLPGLLFDPETLRPVLGAGAGELSGPATLPVALRRVRDVRTALPDAAIVGAGGVRSGVDVVQMLLAGATAVQVGTALVHDPSAPDRILTELRDELSRHGFTTPSALHQEAP